jgi:two-component system NtrC family sensor kinase
MDANGIQQLVLNLTLNALDALIDSEKRELNVDMRPEGEFVRITIADTGCGIASESLGSIFDPFFTTKAAEQGTGLGLSVSQGIVTAHGGKITCESKPGAGTEFTILLPIKRRMAHAQ